MAVLIDNFILASIAGQIGGQLVIRKRKGQVVISKSPSKRKSSSEAQRRQMKRFREATLYAKKALADEEIRQMYDDKACKADRCLSATNVAVADYLNGPVIRDVDLSGYSGGLQDEIRVFATDDFRVESVMVEIFRDDGSLLEVGMADPAADELYWVYYAQSVNVSPEGCKLVVSVSDLPGNVARQEHVI